MFGAILGDICASVYEFNNHKTEQADTIDLTRPDCTFTDDTVLTVAVAQACLENSDYGQALRLWAGRYPQSGYGGRFSAWLAADNPTPYRSWGNGSAMRVSPVAWAYEDLETVLHEARRSALPTHNHPEGIRGAQATAAAIFLARTGAGKQGIANYIQDHFFYDLQRKVADIRHDYSFKVSCMRTVPESLIVFLESRDFAHALRLAVSIGGDSDTIACIVGGIAQAYYGRIPPELASFGLARIPEPIRQVLAAFEARYGL